MCLTLFSEFHCIVLWVFVIELLKLNKVGTLVINSTWQMRILGIYLGYRLVSVPNWQYFSFLFFSLEKFKT